MRGLIDNQKMQNEAVIREAAKALVDHNNDKAVDIVMANLSIPNLVDAVVAQAHILKPGLNYSAADLMSLI